jgi:hypothetical protein
VAQYSVPCRLFGLVAMASSFIITR